MASLVETINEISYDCSQAFLMKAIPLNDSIKDAVSNHGLNSETCKRICEKCNQTVYLGLFKNPETDRANIKFPLADFEQIWGTIKDEEHAMTDYISAPQDYRTDTTKTASLAFDASMADSSHERLEIMNKIADAKGKLGLLRLGMETVKAASLRDADIIVGKIHEQARTMAVMGESFGDVVKIACRNVEEHGLGLEKSAQVLAYIGGAIQDEGLKLDMELTKLSSVPAVNPKHPFNAAVLDYTVCLEKAASASEVITGIDSHVKQLDVLMEATVSA